MIRKILLAASMSLAMLFGATAPSFAAPVLDDNFETAAASNWTFPHSGADAGGNISTTDSFSPTHNAFVTIRGAGFSAAGRLVSLASVPKPANCHADILVKPLSVGTINVEVINPATFTYIALRTQALAPSPYSTQAINWTAAAGSPSTVLFRVSLLGTTDGSRSSIRLDDLHVRC
jgi:hypothetical protein